MPTNRRSRQPVSCEPCRARKIACPRDGNPCGTCVRRRVRPSLCTYANQCISNGERTEYPEATSEPSSSDLADRVAKLEHLLQLQQSQKLPTSPERSYASPQTPQDRPFNQGAVDISDMRQPDNSSQISTNQQCIGHLETSPSGHVRYMPFGTTWNAASSTTTSNTQQAAYTLDTTHWPLPFNRSSDKILGEVVALLPSRTSCAKIKDVFFESFAPVCCYDIREIARLIFLKSCSMYSMTPHSMINISASNRSQRLRRLLGWRCFSQFSGPAC
jgi:hypothetical protein